MSVAFRRESDEEHKEPKFELPLPPGPNLVTPRGLALIEAKVVELQVGAHELDAILRTRGERGRGRPDPDDVAVREVERDPTHHRRAQVKHGARGRVRRPDADGARPVTRTAPRRLPT